MANAWRSPKVKRPREQVAEYVQILTEMLADANLGLQFEFAGSWRRGAASIGDLDCVITTRNGRLAPDLFDPRGVVLPDVISFQRLGPKIAQGDLRLPEDGSLLHVDFWSCSPNEHAAFLMFATGPAPLNLRQRQHAARNGMALSQVGLLDRATKRQLDSGTSEREIYHLLGLPWLTPQERQQYADG
jgi:DNA polymerase/3'-5' exonuclease PolX